MNNSSQTWHYGLVARFWAEHNTSGPEIAYYQKYIERNGQPALDAGCGTGRLLFPFLKAGLEVDGCDASEDMLKLCEEKASKEGFQPRLYEQALHELELPRTYQTIVVCGVFGIGVSREQDMLALQRLYLHLKPGGLLLLDQYLPYENAGEWRLWRKDERKKLPGQWPEAFGKKPPEDGSEYDIESRVLEFDPLKQQFRRQMRTILWKDGQVVEQVEYDLTENVYFYNELALMLEKAGFKIEAVQGDYQEREANADTDVIIFAARR